MVVFAFRRLAPAFHFQERLPLRGFRRVIGFAAAVAVVSTAQAAASFNDPVRIYRGLEPTLWSASTSRSEATAS